MINGEIKHRLQSTFLLVFLVSMVMCNKDEFGPGTEFRVIRTKSSYNDMLSEIADFHYSDERITLIEREIPPMYGQPAMYNKTEVNYPLYDSVVLRNYYLDYESWVYESMVINEILDGNIIRQSYAMGGLESIRTVYEYQYSRNNLSESVIYLYGNPFMRSIFEYYDSSLVRKFKYEYDEDWILTGMDTLFYNGDDLDSLISYTVTDGVRYNDYKEIYYIEDGLNRETDHYDADSASWRHIGHHEYNYDKYRNLTSNSYEIGGTVYKTDYYYEEGKGNYCQVVASPKI